MPSGDKKTATRPPPGTATEARGRCPECGAAVSGLAAHLRQAHHVFEFRGTRRSYNDTVAYLLSLLLAGRHDPEAWDTLDAMAREEHGERADHFLATLLAQALARLDDDKRVPVAESIGQLLAAAGAVRLTAVLASDAEPVARHLALAVLAHLPPPLPAALVAPLRGLLLDRRLPDEQQLAAAAVLIRGAGPSSPLAEEVLETLIGGLGRVRGIERLRRLGELLGPTPAIDALCARLEDRARLTCPRCGAEHRRPEMVEHLWQEHRLVLDGRRVRDPWSLVEEWIDAWKARRDPAFLERCRNAAGRIDPDGGPDRLRRLLLARGVEDTDSLRGLLGQAREAHASLCPACFADVPLPRPAPLAFINLYRGRLSARGYRVELTEPGVQTLLEVETPAGLVSRGPEPGRHRIAPRAAGSAAATPLVLLGLIVACGLASFPPFIPVLLLLITAAAAWYWVRRAWDPPRARAERLRGYAWTLLTPRLHEKQFHPEDSAFLAGLARHSLGRGPVRERAAALAEQVRRTEAALARGEAPLAHLAILCRLQGEDAARTGGDPVPAVATVLGRCFTGRLPMDFAEHLLHGWDSDWWTRGNRARLRALVCQRAFEAGFEVRTLRAAARTAPALAAVLEPDRPDNLGALRLLWALAPRKPWQACGKCLTAFEVAAERDRARLMGRYPDLLLYQEEPDWPPVAVGPREPEPVRILLCTRGVALQDVLFTEAPLLVDQVNRPGATDLTFDGEHRFHIRSRFGDIGPRMKQWFAFAFEDFLPRVPDALRRRPADPAVERRAAGAVACPSCGRHLLARAGELAAALDAETPES
jgi:hypothetical protein